MKLGRVNPARVREIATAFSWQPSDYLCHLARIDIAMCGEYEPGTLRRLRNLAEPFAA